MLAGLDAGADYLPGVHPFGRDAYRSHFRRENPAGQQFAAALDRVQTRRAQLTEQENALGNAPDRRECVVADLRGLFVCLDREELPDDLMVLLLKFVQETQI